jgi:Methyltransferase domain
MKPLARTAWKVFPFKQAAKRFYRSPAAPVHWPHAVRACHILTHGYGYLRTVARQECLDADGQPIPWYTYPALEFIRQLDFRDCSVFEYGSGNSTLFWSRLARRVISVEHDREWFQRMRSTAPPNCEMLLEEDAERYVNAARTTGEAFDVIIIDGQSRLRCVPAAVESLRAGGVIILDNSDWFPRTSELLRTYDVIEVDMSGFGPINDYTSTTSFYFDRRFALKPRSERQPIPGIGSRPNSFDEAWWKPDTA